MQSYVIICHSVTCNQVVLNTALTNAHKQGYIPVIAQVIIGKSVVSAGIIGR